MERFNINTESATAPDLMVREGQVRVSVITPYLIRVERGNFTDEATQCVWYRNFDLPSFSYEVKGRAMTVRTEKITASVDIMSGKVHYIILADGRKVHNFKRGNLRGTVRTLDMTSGAVPLGEGLVSRGGVGVLDDSDTLLLQGDKILPRPKCSDKYYFAYGNNYRLAISDFYKLSGPTPLIPKFAFGNWWSRYKAYTQEEYRLLMQQFIDKKVPITVATIDMDWHWVDVVGKFGKGAKAAPTANLQDKIIYGRMPGWTGYSWNTDLFPDYRELLKWLCDRGMTVTLNIHPSQGIRSFEDCYAAACKIMGYNPEDKNPIRFSLGNDKFLEAYFDAAHHPYEDEGVRFWWIDWQQGTKSDVEGLDPLWGLNHYHSIDSSRGGKRPLILSRYAGIGSHRYPLGFSGDSAINWQTLKFQPYMTVTATNVGYSFWSHDIGGHHFGYKDDELYLRWLEFGVFSPVNRLHSTSNEFMGKEPWKCSKYIGEIAEKYLKLRHKLIPYIYTANYRTHIEGKALMEPMYYAYDCREAYEAPNQYIFGSELIVVPITEHSSSLTGLASADLWVPEGEKYTDVFTGRIYTPGRYKIYRDLDETPVFAHEGSIIPMYRHADTNDLSIHQPLDVLVYAGDGEYDLYDDDGDSMAYQDGKYVILNMKTRKAGDKITFTLKQSGDIAMAPERKVRVIFRDVAKGNAALNGQPCEWSPEGIEVTLKGEEEASIVIEKVVLKENREYREAAIDLISRVQMSNLLKTSLFKRALERNSSTAHYPKSVRGALEELRKICK